MNVVRRRWFSLTSLWCVVMHNQMTWPIHGTYSCRKCLRVYSVPWGR